MKTTGRRASSGEPHGSLVDESFPRERVHRAMGTFASKIDLAEFDAFFGPRLALYRAAEEGMENLLPPAEARRLLEEAEGHINALRGLLPTLAPELNVVCWERQHLLFDDYLRPFDLRLQTTGEMVIAASEKINDRPGMVGRKSSVYRDRLLHDVAVKLRDLGRLGKGDAAAKAAAVLVAAGVPAPGGDREAEKVVSKVARGLREN